MTCYFAKVFFVRGNQTILSECNDFGDKCAEGKAPNDIAQDQLTSQESCSAKSPAFVKQIKAIYSNTCSSLCITGGNKGHAGLL